MSSKRQFRIVYDPALDSWAVMQADVEGWTPFVAHRSETLEGAVKYVANLTGGLVMLAVSNENY